MLISVVVGTTRSGTLKYLVQSIIRQEYENWELIILEQGNDPKLKVEVRETLALDCRIQAYNMDGFGLSKARNLGIKAARGDVIAFTDDDCEADPRWLASIAECFQAEPEVGIVAGNVVAPKASAFSISTCPSAQVREYIYRPSQLNYHAPPFFYFIGANFSVSSSALAVIGLFDEILGVGSEFSAGEDTDFCLRAEALNIAMWTTPRSIIYHTYGRRSGIRQVLKHQKAYARGKGALIGKLTLMNHRLAKEWSQEPTLKEKFIRLSKKPRWVVLEMYVAKEVSSGKEDYLNHYTLGPDCVSMPKKRIMTASDV
jgi:glycosyltransferase involved in cell wall biosynthesis